MKRMFKRLTVDHLLEMKMKYFAIGFIFLTLFCWATDAKTQSVWDQILEQFSETFARIPKEIQTVAVFKVEGEGDFDRKMFQGKIETALVKSGRFGVIERATLNALLEEQKLSMTGLVSQKEMIEVGKLVGAQGFFIVSVNKKKEETTCHFKLVDVETGAIVYSETFTGKRKDISSLGITIGYAKPPSLCFDSEMQIYKIFDGYGFNNKEVIFHHEKLSPTRSQGIGLCFSYLSGFSIIENIKLGVDLALHRLAGEVKIGTVSVKEQITNTDGEVYEITGSPEFSITRAGSITIRPKVYWTPTELLHIYFGGEFGMHDISAHLGGWYSFIKKKPEYEEMYHVGTNESKHNMVLLVAPLVGLKFHFTRSLSAYVDCVYYISDSQYEYDQWGGDTEGGTDKGWRFKYSPILGKGPVLSFGVSFAPFRW